MNFLGTSNPTMAVLRKVASNGKIINLPEASSVFSKITAGYIRYNRNKILTFTAK
ncbi:MAG: hypothetical protein IPG08_04875 [Sphingobacteriaceae bacterium]|nr:hypothetical protein [Sphingobacteriaceae bacterium]